MNIILPKNFMDQPKYDNCRHNGYVTLISVLITGAVALAVAVFLLALGTGLTKSAIVFERSQKAKSQAQGCSEDALEQIRESQDFSGNSTLTFDDGTCVYEVIKLAGEAREIRTTSNVKSVTRKIKISLDKINPQINITSWKEVADF